MAWYVSVQLAPKRTAGWFMETMWNVYLVVDSCMCMCCTLHLAPTSTSARMLLIEPNQAMVRWWIKARNKIERSCFDNNWSKDRSRLRQRVWKRWGRGGQYRARSVNASCRQKRTTVNTWMSGAEEKPRLQGGGNNPQKGTSVMFDTSVFIVSLSQHEDVH